VNKILLFVLLFCAAGTACFGQDQSGDIPAGNPVQFPTGNAQWTIDVTYKASPPAPGATPKPTTASGRVKKIEVTQSDTIERTVVTLDTGKKSENWFHIPTQILITTNTPSGGPVCFSSRESEMIKSFATGFEPADFQWLNKEHFVAFISYKGQSCLHYRVDIEPTSPDRREAGGIFGIYEAWVDKDTHLPIALSKASVTGIYTFAKSAPEPLTMPPAIASALAFFTTPPRMP
jgi:hypothetical protein